LGASTCEPFKFNTFQFFIQGDQTEMIILFQLAGHKGVTLHSPLAKLKFVSLSSKKKKETMVQQTGRKLKWMIPMVRWL
jgi:hypothetical protein